MKRFTQAYAIAFGLLALIWAGPASAEMWQGAGTVGTGRVSLGGFGKLYFDPSDFNFFGNVTYGFTPTLQGEFRLGLGSADAYVGGFLKNTVHHGDIADVAIWGGIHHQGRTYIDLAPVFSHSFQGVELYAAPLFLIKLDGPGDTLGAALVPGLGAPIARNLRLYGEFTIKVANYYNAFSAGVRYFF